MKNDKTDQSLNPDFIQVNSSKGVEVAEPEFDITFQAGVLRLALKNEYFCSQLVRYLGHDKDLAQFEAFSNTCYHFIFKVICESMDHYQTRPTETQIRTAILKFAEDEQLVYFNALKEIQSTDIHNEKFLINRITKYVTHVKLVKTHNGAKKLFKSSPSKVTDFYASQVDSIRRIEFEKEDILRLSDLGSLLTKSKEKSGQKIPTGLIELDSDLHGGFPRETLITVLGAANAGKTIFCTSLACNALRAGFKVLHINLEGTRDETLHRYYANLSQIETNSFEDGVFTQDENKRVAEALKDYESNLLIRNMLSYGVTVESVIAYCREVYKDFKFDMIVVDYGQILKSAAHADTFERQTEVHRGLDSMSKEFRCVVVTPVQSNREGIKVGRETKKGKLPVLRSEHMADCIEICRISAIIITLNRNEEEEASDRVRIFLEKQRRGKKAIVYPIIADYKRATLITNNYYDPEAKSSSTKIEDEDGPSMVVNVTNEYKDLLRKKLEFSYKLDAGTLTDDDKHELNLLNESITRMQQRYGLSEKKKAELVPDLSEAA